VQAAFRVAGHRYSTACWTESRVHLSAMPGEAVVACRRAWAGLAGTPEAGRARRPGPAATRVTGGGVGLWAEERTTAGSRFRRPAVVSVQVS
jgi:hypothetical protein